MDIKLRKGTRVKILRDVRVGGSATGKIGKFIGQKIDKVWILFYANGIPESESYKLPDGYVEWYPEEEKFPKVKCGVRSRNPIFLLDDGSEIYGSRCHWEPVNPKIRKRIKSIYMGLLKQAERKDLREC